MSILDIIIIIPLIYGAYKGFTKGLLRELTSLLAVILAITLGFKLMDLVIALIQPYLGENNQIVPLIAFVAIFVVVLILVNLLSKAVKKVLDMTLLGNVDDFAGAVLGILKWAFAMSMILWLLDQAQIIIPKERTEGSILFPFLMAYGPKLIDYVSIILPFTQDLIHSISEHIKPPI